MKLLPMKLLREELLTIPVPTAAQHVPGVSTRHTHMQSLRGLQGVEQGWHMNAVERCNGTFRHAAGSKSVKGRAS